MDGHAKPAARRPPRTVARRPVVAVVLVVALAIAATGCWPAPGQGPDRSSYNPFETVITPATVGSLAPVWTATIEPDMTGGVVGPPVVSNAGVHVSDGTAVHSFDLATGTRLWMVPDSPVINGAIGDPIADGNRVMVTTGFPVGFGGAWNTNTNWHDARTGAYQENVPTSRVTGRRGSWVASYSAQGGPVVGLYLFGLQVRDLADPGSGWGIMARFGTAPAFAPPATLGRERLYYAGPATVAFDPLTNVTGVRAFSLQTPPPTCVPPPEGLPIGGLSCPLWATPTDGAPVTSPVLAADESVVYVTTSTGTLLAFDAADGQVRWSAPLGATASADPALAEGWIYVALDDGRLVALPAGGCGAATCGVAWQADVGGAGVQPAVAGGLVFVGTDAGHVVALPAAGCGKANCPVRWRHDFGAPITGAPAVTNGRLYIGVSPNQVVALAPD